MNDPQPSRKKKAKAKKGTVHPSDGDELLELPEINAFPSIQNNLKSNKDKESALKRVVKSVVGLKNNFGESMDSVDIKSFASKWKHYVAKRRTRNSPTSAVRRLYSGAGLGDLHSQYCDLPDKTKRKMTVASNRALMEHFGKLGQKGKEDEQLDFNFIATLVKQGADINCTDVCGQTVLHEVARAWHVDVAQFLLDLDADIDKPDLYGRTALHVAAATDYPEMVDFLVKNGANKEAQTKDELQTPVFYAAKNDACSSMRCLIKSGAEYKHIRDYKGRTPIYVAAELDRSETARQLLEYQAPVGVTDHSGQPALTWMIMKMVPVAKEALNQFHTTDRPNRKQYFYLNFLEPLKAGETCEGCPQMPLQTAVLWKQHDLLLHPVLSQIIKVKWSEFARAGAIKNLLFNMFFIALWTVIALHRPYDTKYKYDLPDDGWRILFYVLAVVFTMYQIADELKEFFVSKREHNKWKEWRSDEIDRDIQFCHPRWPEEKQFLESEKHQLDDARPQYFNDFWNIFDWACYILLLTSTVTHIIDFSAHTTDIAKWNNRIMSVNIIMVWLRLMKSARAFSLLGPFIVMLGKMMGDVLKFMFLYLEFFIPFYCAYWMNFGGHRTAEYPTTVNDTSSYDSVIVNGMETPGELIVTLFRMTLVDEYDYDGMKKVDVGMAYLLIIFWLAISAILCLNIFIALMSDTFQRVYDNAQANAVMQKAVTIISIEEAMWKKKREKFRRFIHTKCSPLALYYDDDDNADGPDLNKATLQIRAKLEDIEEWWHEKFGKPEGGDMSEDFSGNGRFDARESQNLRKDVEKLSKDIIKMREKQDSFNRRYVHDMDFVKKTLCDVANAVAGQHDHEQALHGLDLFTGPDPRIDGGDVSVAGPVVHRLPPISGGPPAAEADRITPRSDRPRPKVEHIPTSQPLLDVSVVTSHMMSSPPEGSVLDQLPVRIRPNLQETSQFPASSDA